MIDDLKRLRVIYVRCCWRGVVRILALFLVLGTPSLKAQELIGYVKNTVNPEDLTLISGTKWVIASSDKTPGKRKPAYLYLIDSQSGTARSVSAKVAAVPTAGDPECTPIKLVDLALSGLAMRTEPSGIHQLLAVNRGARMSVEIFDIDTSAKMPAFKWSGCIVMPPNSFPNSVVPLKNGGFATTISFETNNSQMINDLEHKRPTGYLLEWSRQSGFRRIPHSELPLNNGLKIDAGENFYYISGWGSESLLRLSTSGDEPPLEINIGMKPDNLSWSTAGTLIVAGQIQSAAAIFGCVASSADACPMPFKVIEVNPNTLATIRILAHGEDEGSYAGATTGLQVGSELWVSSFRNNKIARYVYPKNKVKVSVMHD